MDEQERIDIMRHSTATGTGAEQYPAWLWDSLSRFQDRRFGLFIHWGIYSQWGCIESWPLVAADAWARPDDLACWIERDRDLDRFRRDYWALNRTFNPRAFDPDSWAALAQAAGMRYVAFTTKHHDGFCMFDTRTTDYRVTGPACPFHANPRADVVRAVYDAFRARGLAISCYFSKSDWQHPGYWDPARPAPDRNPNYDTRAEPERWAGFQQYVYDQIEELMRGYGPIEALWLDGGQVRPPLQDIRMDRIAAMARRHQPGLIMADRVVGGIYENILTPEQEIPAAPLGHPWESCITMGSSWSYKPDDTYKSVGELIRMLLDTIAKDGNLLLNVGPDADGRFPDAAVERLRAIGDWMRVNGTAVHETRAIAPYAEGNIRYTRKADTIYAAVLPESGGDAPPREVILRGLRPAPGGSVTMLGVDEPLVWRIVDGAARITMPDRLPCRHAWVLRFQDELNDAG